MQVVTCFSKNIITSSANKNTSEKIAVQETSDLWFQYQTQKIKVQNLFREGRKQIIVFYVPSIHLQTFTLI